MLKCYRETLFERKICEEIGRKAFETTPASFEIGRRTAADYAGGASMMAEAPASETAAASSGEPMQPMGA
jgi:hypothetical protein